MSFDLVAPFYRWLETLVFGRQLQEARVAFLREIRSPRRVLIVGEGNGRFLSELVRHYPAARIDCLDQSAKMLALARSSAGPRERIQFIQGDLRTLDLPEARYDLLVTHFFLDCFSEKSLAPVMQKLSASATAEAQWLVADFWPPASGWRRALAQALIAFMYLFFRLVAGIEARRLVDYRPLLRREGFALQARKISPNEMIRSELWQRPSPVLA